MIVGQGSSFAQSQQKLIKKAKKLELSGDYESAAQFYIEASSTLNRKSTLENTQYSTFKAGECHQVLGHDSLALFFYDKALRLKYNEVNPRIYWNLGELYCKQNICSKAEFFLKEYKNKMPNDSLIHDGIKDCECPIFLDLWVSFSDDYDLSEKMNVRVSGTDGLDTLISVKKNEGVKLGLGIIKVGYDYTIELLSNSKRIGNRDRFTTKNITKSTRIIREISILYGCGRDNVIYDDSLIFIDLILVLRNFETDEIVPFTEVTLESTIGEKYFFISDENGEIHITVDKQGDRVIKVNQEYKIVICDWKQPVLDGYIRFDTYGFSKSIRIVKEVIWSECY